MTSRTLRLQLLDDPHAASLTDRTALFAEHAGWFGIWKGLWLRGQPLTQQLPAALQILSPDAVGHEAVVPDAYEAGWQDVQEKATNELGRFQGHGALPIAPRVVLPAERDLAILQTKQASVGNGYSVGVPSQVLEHDLGTAERRGSILPIITKNRLSSATRTIRCQVGRASSAEARLSVMFRIIE